MANDTAVTEAVLIGADVVAAMCSMHRATWYKAVASGKAPAGIRIGGVVRWRKDEIEAWIAANCPPRGKWETMQRSSFSKQGKRT